MTNQFRWANEQVVSPADEDAPPEYDDPTRDVHEWALNDRERRIFEAGFMVGWGERQPELDTLNYEADRLYRTAFDHRDCPCWKGRKHPFQ
jgi:hypothetical protein